MGNKKNFGYQLILGVTGTKDMPEEIKEEITKYIEDTAAPKINEEIHGLIEKYCNDNNIPMPEGTSDHTVLKGGDWDLDKDSSTNPATQMQDFFKELGKKKGIKIEESRNHRRQRMQTSLDDLKEELGELTSNINPDSTEEEKSILAYQILTLKVRLEKEKIDASFEELNRDAKEKFSVLKAVSKSLPKDDGKIFEHVEQDFTRVEGLLEQCQRNLNNLLVMDLEEYTKMDYESRGKFLKDMKKELDNLVEYLEDELTEVKNKLLKILSKKMQFGDHLLAVLFK